MKMKNHKTVIFCIRVQALLVFLCCFLCFSVGAVAAEEDSEIPFPVQSAKNSVWKITSPLGSGTGFFIGPRLFVTNFHIISSMLENHTLKDIFLFQEQEEEFVSLQIKQVVALSALYDLALIEVERSVEHYLTLRDSPPESEEDLFVLGYPQKSFTEIKKTGSILFSGYEYYSFAVNHFNLFGGSGSPVLDEQGKTVGVASRANKNILHAFNVEHSMEFFKRNIGIDCTVFTSVEDCITEAIESLEVLAEQGSIAAQFSLGYIYKDSDPQKTFKWFMKAAEQGHPEAQFNVGVMHYYERGVEQNFQKAFEWFTRAAEQSDHVPAQYNLGSMYSKGEGVEQNFQKAVEWWEKAAQQNLAVAQFDLGVTYAEGDWIAKDLQKAFEWFLKAAKQGHPDAQLNLAALYIQGVGVEKDLDRAKYWLLKSIENLLKQSN